MIYYLQAGTRVKRRRRHSTEIFSGRNTITMNNEDTHTKDKVFVIGHKSPDTDSICSAIAYAELRNQSGDADYIACRAGIVNEETKFVLKYPSSVEVL